jgi:hypothetical protein
MTSKTQMRVVEKREVTFDRAALRKGFGSEDIDFAEGILNQIMNVASHGREVD